jgi:hypothetical protein
MKLPAFLRDRLCRWALRIIATRPPDFVIGEWLDPYLERWHVIQPNRFLSLYIHRIRKSDDNRALHDHRSATLSVILRGFYDELTPTSGDMDWLTINRRRAGDVVLRRPSALHRLEVGEASAVTLFVTGPTVRTWGFQTPGGWLPYTDYFRIFGDGR